MRKLATRLTAMLLSCMLVFGSVPGAVFAADAGETAEYAEEVYEDGEVEESSADEAAGASEEEVVEEEAYSEEDAQDSSETDEETYSDEEAADMSEDTSEEADVEYYTVTLDANGGYFENEWDDAAGDYVEQAVEIIRQIPAGGTVPAVVPVFVDSDGQTMLFAGWSLEPDGEVVSPAEEEYVPVESCALYAVWEAAEAEDAGVADTGTVADKNAGLADTEQEAEADYEDSEAVEETEYTEEEKAGSGDTEAAEETEAAQESEKSETAEETEAEEYTEAEEAEGGDTEEMEAAEESEDTGSVEETEEDRESESDEAAEESEDTGSVEETEADQESESDEAVEETETGSEDTETAEEESAQEYEDTETENKQETAPAREVIYSDEEEEETNEEAVDASVVESSEKEETVSEDAANGVVESGTCGKNGDNLTWTLDDEGTLVISGTGEMEDFFYFAEDVSPYPWPGNRIETVIINSGVTSIGEHAFTECENLTSITIPAGVTSIGEFAFDNCSCLTSITIPDSVTSIGDSAFFECDSLTSITIPDSITGISQEAFYGCSSLTSITIPDSVTSIGTCAFYNCENLSDVFIPSSVSDIDEYAFYHYSDEGNEPIRGLTISGYWGTEAQRYANVNDIPFRSYSISDARITVPAQTYAGKALRPAVTVKIDGVRLRLNTDYTVTYNNNTYAGTASVKITGKGKYKGTKRGTFKINKAAQSLKVKTSAPRVTAGKTATVSVTGNKGKKSFKSSDTAVATVSSTGKVTTKKAGTVKITVTAAATDNFKKTSKSVTIKVLPAATKSLTAINGATGIKLTWKKVAGANGYVIYRNNKKVKTISKGATVTWTDKKATTNGAKYTYKVFAKASTDVSTLSKSVTVYRVARPIVKSVKNTPTGNVTVTWGKNTKANGYEIQYGLKKDFSVAKRYTVKNKTTLKMVLTRFTKGKTYYIRIRTYKTVGKKTYWSAWSEKKSLKITK